MADSSFKTKWFCPEWKAVKAALVLVPLFGLHFFLVIYKPQSGECSMLEAYTFLSYSMDGLQGFLVSLIFCYLNGEVQTLLRRSFQRLRLQRSLTSSSECRRSTKSDALIKMVEVGGARHSRSCLDSKKGESSSAVIKATGR